MARKMMINIDNINDFLTFALEMDRPAAPSEAFKRIIAEGDSVDSLMRGLRKGMDIYSDHAHPALMFGFLMGSILARVSDKQEFEVLLTKIKEGPKNITPIQAAKNWGNK